MHRSASMLYAHVHLCARMRDGPSSLRRVTRSVEHLRGAAFACSEKRAETACVTRHSF
jgi:hypothetical protein